MSLAARLLNIVAVPGEVFSELKTAAPSVSNWLVPGVFGAIVGAISVFILLSQPAIQKQLHDSQSRLLEKAAKAGHLTEQDRTVAQIITGSTAMKVWAVIGAVAGSFGSLLMWGFILCVLGRALLKVPLTFSKTLEVAGLSMMIDVLGGMVALLLLTQLGGIKDLESARKSHLFAATASMFAFWVVAVRSLGLAKLADVPYLRAAWLVVGCWILEQSLLVLTGLGQLAS
jgi:hypothetical protein